jgi:hypothetical protein
MSDSRGKVIQRSFLLNQFHCRELGEILSSNSFFTKFYDLKGYVSPEWTIHLIFFSTPLKSRLKEDALSAAALLAIAPLVTEIKMSGFDCQDLHAYLQDIW